jgi:hypothetical protein
MGEIKLTEKLQEVELHYLLQGKKLVTLCNECLEQQRKYPKFFVDITVTENTPHVHCNLCGAITTEAYAKKYS